MSTDERHAYLPEGDEGYFHTENDPDHEAQQSPPTPLVLASQGMSGEVGETKGAPLNDGESGAGDDEFDGLTNPQLAALIEERGIQFDGNPAKANKAQLLEALRA